jgi:hypothetical protein
MVQDVFPTLNFPWFSVDGGSIKRRQKSGTWTLTEAESFAAGKEKQK